MPLPALPNLGIVRPVPGADRDTWGAISNTAWGVTDAVFAGDGSGTSVGLRVGTGKVLKVEGSFDLAAGATIPGGNLANGSVTLPKIENINTDRVLGRATAGAGPPEQIICTPAARALLDDADAAEQRTTLGVPKLDGANTFIGDQTVQATGASAGAGPLLALDRASASPDVDDLLGSIEFRGRNLSAAVKTYAAILTQLKDATAASEDGVLLLQSMVAGALATRFTLGQGLFAPGLADKGAGTINALQYFQNDVPLQLFLRGHIDGFVLQNDTTDANNDIVIKSGQATADSNDYLMERGNITKRLDAVWAVGSDQGGLDTGSKTANTWYHVFVIARPDTGVVDVLFSASLSPTLPTSYTKKRRVGSILTTSGNNIKAFTQVGNEFEWVTPVIDLDVGPASGVQNAGLTVPDGIRVVAHFVPGYRLGGSIKNQTLDVHSRDAADQIPHDPTVAAISGATGAAIISPGSPNDGSTPLWSFSGDMWVTTDNNKRVQYRSTDTSGGTRVAIITRGWRDFRGRDA